MFHEIHEISSAERLRRMEESEERRRFNRMIEEMANTRIDIYRERHPEQVVKSEPATLDFDPDKLIGA
jgi:hypothetical protein